MAAMRALFDREKRLLFSLGALSGICGLEYCPYVTFKLEVLDWNFASFAVTCLALYYAWLQLHQQKIARRIEATAYASAAAIELNLTSLRIVEVMTRIRGAFGHRDNPQGPRILRQEAAAVASTITSISDRALDAAAKNASIFSAKVGRDIAWLLGFLRTMKDESSETRTPLVDPLAYIARLLPLVIDCAKMIGKLQVELWRLGELHSNPPANPILEDEMRRFAEVGRVVAGGGAN